MADDRVAARLRPLRQPVVPDPEFAERLFLRLVAEVDFERGTVRRASLPSRVRRAWQLTARERRVIWTLAAVALLLGLLLSLAIIGSRVPAPSELVSRSQAVYDSPPAFEMTVAMPTIVVRYRFDGAGLLRGDILPGRSGSGRGVGTYFVFDGVRYHEFDSRGRLVGSFAMQGVPVGWYGRALLAPYNDYSVGERSTPLAPFPLTWTLAQTFELPPPITNCAGAERGPDELVAGRLTYRLTCPTVRNSYWVDTETLFVLKVLNRGGEVFEATSVDFAPSFEPGTFDIPDGPGGARPLVYGAMEPGAYFTPVFTPTITFRLGDGWFNGFDRHSDGRLSRENVDLLFVRVDRLVDPETGEAVPFDGSATDFVAWLERHPALAISAPEPAQLPGASGVEFELSVRPGTAGVPCENTPQFQCVFVLAIDVGHIQLALDARARVVALDVQGETVVLLAFGDGAGDVDLPAILAFP
ncbi:MAG TPA: hypothetical protein VFK54_06460 [Candidatus Limnocylindrales bacterium]|nr:hypothetical protein [Candidatus Limnocylindrales bacterium]